MSRSRNLVFYLVWHLLSLQYDIVVFLAIHVEATVVKLRSARDVGCETGAECGEAG